MTKPALMTCGKTAMHWDLSGTVFGIALSGAAMISVKTLAAFEACLAASPSSLVKTAAVVISERHNAPMRLRVNLNFMCSPVDWIVCLNGLVSLVVWGNQHCGFSLNSGGK